jgi:DNA-binding Lrp family transcriptional regulator
MDKKELETLRLLSALMDNSRRSDRELAKALGLSQPTVSRKRVKLENEGYIQEYTAIPNLTKMGYDFIAVTFLSFTEDRPDLFEKAREWTKNQSSVLFAANGEGLSMNSIMLSIHENYASYSKLITDLRQDWQPNLKETESFLISLHRPELLIKNFSFKHLKHHQ